MRIAGTFILVVAAYLALSPTAMPLLAVQNAPSGVSPLPSSLPVADLEIRLDRNTGGGCVGRCVHYRITIRGDGSVTYADLAEPPVQPRRRTVAIDDVVSLANEFVRARFFDASERYVGESLYVREGDRLVLRGSGGADGPEWDLSFRLGGPSRSSVCTWVIQSTLADCGTSLISWAAPERGARPSSPAASNIQMEPSRLGVFVMVFLRRAAHLER